MSEAPVSNLDDMLTGMEPVLADQAYAFRRLGDGEKVSGKIFALIHEAEGATAVEPVNGQAEGSSSFAKITLQVHSSLEGVGLTAAVSTTLAANGIACNVIAAFHHDHLFVPWHRREEALQTLKDLSENARRKM